MSEMTVPLGVMLATIGTSVGLLLAEMFPATSEPVQALRQLEPKRPSQPQSNEPTEIAA